jgi:hypothetical protein
MAWWQRRGGEEPRVALLGAALHGTMMPGHLDADLEVPRPQGAGGACSGSNCADRGALLRIASLMMPGARSARQEGAGGSFAGRIWRAIGVASSRDRRGFGLLVADMYFAKLNDAGAVIAAAALGSARKLAAAWMLRMGSGSRRRLGPGA